MADERMDREESPDLTGLLLAWRGGDEQALHRLMSAVERQLLRMARGMLGDLAWPRRPGPEAQEPTA